jgi:hypothetical protein
MLAPLVRQDDKRKTDVADCAIEVPEPCESGRARGAPILRLKELVSSDKMDSSLSNGDLGLSWFIGRDTGSSGGRQHLTLA